MRFDTLTEIQELVETILWRLGRTDIRPTVRWNRRFTTRIADANAARGEIRIGVRPWARMDEKQREDTIVHETCHLVAPGGHGAAWRQAMRRCGVEPKVKVRIAALQSLHRRNQLRMMTYCGCGEHPVTVRKWNRMMRGSIYRCRKCRTIMTRRPRYEKKGSTT